MDPKLLAQLHETFRSELEEQCRVVTDGLLALERSTGGEPPLEETLNAMFRAAHNVKGAARSVDLGGIAEAAHRLESLFSRLRERARPPTPEVVDAALEALDWMRSALDDPASGAPDAPGLAALAARLDAAAGGNEAPAPAPGAGSGDAAPARRGAAPAAPPREAPPARAAHPPGGGVETTAVPEPPGDPVPAGRGSPPPRRAAVPGSRGARQVRVSARRVASVAALADELQVTKIGLEERRARLRDLDVRCRELSSLWRRLQPAIEAETGLAPALRQGLASARELAAEIEERVARLHEGLRGSASRLGMVTRALQDDVRGLRLVPLGTLIRPMLRSVREIAREQGKTVKVEVRGDDVEMDRLVLEGVRDPLLHLLRNAVDHGLESPVEREAAGKEGAGRLEIEVEPEGGQIVVRVRDDGRGLDAAGVRAAAARRQIASAAELERLGDAEVLDLVFHPGLSTREIVTEVSGRGFGLDVVRTAVEALKGRVEIATVPGEGTTVTLRLPVMLSTERGLHVQVAGESAMLPSVAVERILEVPAGEVGRAQGEAVVVVGGRAVPVRRLAVLLGLGETGAPSPDASPVVVVNRGAARAAFLVDDVLGEGEIVVKPLRPPLERTPNVRGATLTGDGRVVMVLDPAGLVEAALDEAGGDEVLPAAAPATLPPRRPRILVVDDSITTRTLESNILRGHGYEVEVATDGDEAWRTLRAGEFDLVLTDVEMPRMNGFELTERIKTNADLADTPVIIVSSLARDSDRRRGLEVGADAYITKGQFETGALLQTVSQLL